MTLIRSRLLFGDLPKVPVQLARSPYFRCMSATEPAGYQALVVLDTETTGTDPQRHEVWELAAIRREHDGSITEFHRLLKVTMKNASETALAIGRFERYIESEAVEPEQAIREFVEFASGSVLAGLNVSFDVGFLRVLLDRGGLHPSWHYSPVDIKSLAAGALGLAPPWRSEEIAAELAVNPADYARHTALSDCYYAAAIYDAAYAITADDQPALVDELAWVDETSGTASLTPARQAREMERQPESAPVDLMAAARSAMIGVIVGIALGILVGIRVGVAVGVGIGVIASILLGAVSITSWVFLQTLRAARGS